MLLTMDGQDFRSFDWDDTELLRAYNRGLEARKAKKEENKKNSRPKENKRRKWNVGDFCKALYSTDNLYYEAKVISLNGDFCTVEYLGYDETEDVDLLQLKESGGKKARREQIKANLNDSFEALEETTDTAGDASDGTIISRNLYRKKSHLNQTVNNTTYDTTMYEAACHQQYNAPPAPAPYYAPPMPQTSLPFMPPTSVPQFSVPAGPPMPMCPNQANNPAFASMLTSWYMAGYYTGINSVQKENHGCQRCCSHSNQCCRN